MDAVLKLEGISKSFKKQKVLENISLELKPGVYGLVGPNGAGKSTLIRIICGTLKPDHGQVFWNGKPVQKNRMFVSELGVMPQTQNGYREFSGTEFLYYMAALKGLSRREARYRIQKLTKEVGLEKSLNKKVSSYSGGMRQRLMFVQAMLNDPVLLILDEPTAGLDPYERIRMRNLISSTARGKLVLIATHIMQDLEAVADGIIFLNEGYIPFQGSVPDLMKKMEERIAERDVSDEEYQQIQENHKVVRVLQLKDGYRVRYLLNEEDKQKGNAVPDLEDAYLEYLV